jgi:hypothetical protein
MSVLLLYPYVAFSLINILLGYPRCENLDFLWNRCESYSKVSTVDTDALLKMLNFNQEQNAEADSPIVWKVLVYDKAGQDIISPILRLGELRQQGITLHLYIPLM